MSKIRSKMCTNAKNMSHEGPNSRNLIPAKINSFKLYVTSWHVLNNHLLNRGDLFLWGYSHSVQAKNMKFQTLEYANSTGTILYSVYALDYPVHIFYIYMNGPFVITRLVEWRGNGNMIAYWNMRPSRIEMKSIIFG